MRLKQGLFKSKSEGTVHRILERYFHGRAYFIYKDVALNQVIEIARDELQVREFDYFTRASFDFLVCNDDEHQSFEIAIEYDGQYHDDPLQQWRDKTKNMICRKSGLPMIRIGSDVVIDRGGTTILEFVLNQYFGEKEISRLREEGTLGLEEEYFAVFPETVAIQSRLAQKGLFPPIMSSMFDPSARSLFWWRAFQSHEPQARDLGEFGSEWSATTRVEIFRGTSADDEVFSVSRTSKLKNPNPAGTAIGVHGWHIASEIATYLCFAYIEYEWLPD